jgi:hypothetical protein
MTGVRIGRGTVLAGAIALLFACGQALRQDELDCEEAVSYLTRCCPGFAGVGVQCIYDEGCDTGQEPEIAEDTSACIRSRSCAELVSSGVCARAIQGVSGGPNSRVCP